MAAQPSAVPLAVMFERLQGRKSKPPSPLRFTFKTPTDSLNNNKNPWDNNQPNHNIHNADHPSDSNNVESNLKVSEKSGGKGRSNAQMLMKFIFRTKVRRVLRRYLQRFDPPQAKCINTEGGKKAFMDCCFSALLTPYTVLLGS